MGMLPNLPIKQALAENKIVAKRVIIRSEWSMDSFGARTYLPAAYKLVQRNIPFADIYFWPYVDDETVLNKIKLNITKLNLLKGNLGEQGSNDNEVLINTLKTADLVLHFGGTLPVSGIPSDPSNLPVSGNLFDFCFQNKIKYAFHSLKISSGFQFSEPLLKDLNNSVVVLSSYITDNKALEGKGLTARNIESGPDAAFYFDLTEENKANRYLSNNNLAGKQFLFLSLRYNDSVTGDLTLDKHIDKFIQTTESWVNDTGNPVLVFPGNKEDEEYLNNKLIKPLSENVKDKVLLFTDEPDPSILYSIIAKARLCLGNDPYPAMFAVSSRVPVIFIRTHPDDRSYQIFDALSMDDHIIDFNAALPSDLMNVIYSLHKNYVGSLVECDKFAKELPQLEKKSFKSIDKSLGIEENNRTAPKEKKSKRPRE